VEAPSRRPVTRAAEPADEGAAATVSIRIASEPSGATVIDARTGIPLGRTPFAREMRRTPGGIRLSLRKSGYRNKDVTLALDQPADMNVALEKKQAAQPRPPDDEDDDRRKL
jgi:hypothetical protein